jgi:hypothetical protein
MKNILEIRLNSHFVKAPLLRGRIHSQFGRVVNIEFLQDGFQPRLITLLPPGFTGIPDSLVVDTAYFKKISLLPIGTTVIKKSLSFTFDGIEETMEGDNAHLQQDFLCNLNHEFGKHDINNFLGSLKDIYTRVNKQDGFSRLPFSTSQQILQKLRGLCCALIEGNINEIEKKLLLCTGVGYGLTPSSDDAVVGILAAARSGIFGVEVPSMDISKTWKQLERLTTDVSRKYLCCAVEGRFSDTLRNLLRTILIPEKFDCKIYLQAVAEIGSTSGMDMLKGIEIAFREALEAGSFLDRKLHRKVSFM